MNELATGTSDAEPGMRRALIRLRREEFAEAVADFDAEIAADPNAADAYAYRSGALLALGRPREALADIERALRLEPSSFAVNQKAGELNLRLGILQSAADHFLAAVRSAQPGSGDQQAATAALAYVRVRQRSSISHHARLPQLARMASLGSRPRWLANRVRRVSRGSAIS